MKILLVNPPNPYRKDFLVSGDRCQPLGLAYLAAVLRLKDYDVGIIDAPALHYSVSQTVKKISSLKPDIVGLTAVTYNFSRAEKICRQLKQLTNPPITILGGPHLTALPTLIKNSPFDFGVIGEGEQTLAELIRAINNEKHNFTNIKGLIFQRRNELVITPPRPYMQNIDKLPFPSRDLLPALATYRPVPGMFRQLPMATMITSRGCPFQCIFCSRAVFGQTYRARSAKNVVNEMEILMNNFGCREIRIWDDTFNLMPQRVIDICQEILRRQLKFSWSCLCRANFVSNKMLKMMKQAGCWQIAYGIESGNDNILKTINKGLNKNIVQRAVKLTKKAGIETRGFFILGLPGETEQTLRETINFAKNLDLDTAGFNSLIPFPGTEVYQNINRYGKLTNRSFDSFLPQMSTRFVFIPHKLKSSILKTYLDLARREFYRRPGFLLRKIIKIRSLAQTKSYFQALKILAD